MFCSEIDFDTHNNHINESRTSKVFDKCIDSDKINIKAKRSVKSKNNINKNLKYEMVSHDPENRFKSPKRVTFKDNNLCEFHMIENKDEIKRAQNKESDITCACVIF